MIKRIYEFLILIGSFLITIFAIFSFGKRYKELSEQEKILKESLEVKKMKEKNDNIRTKKIRKKMKDDGFIRNE